jgi:hypothetical protein
VRDGRLIHKQVTSTHRVPATDFEVVIYYTCTMVLCTRWQRGCLTEPLKSAASLEVPRSIMKRGGATKLDYGYK